MWMAQPLGLVALVLWYNTNHITTPPTSIQFLFDPALKGRIALTRQQERGRLDRNASGAKKPTT